MRRNKKHGLSDTKMKPASVTFKTTPEIKQALEILAKEGYRSLSAQIEMIITKYLEKQGIDYDKPTSKKPTD